MCRLPGLTEEVTGRDTLLGHSPCSLPGLGAGGTSLSLCAVAGLWSLRGPVAIGPRDRGALDGRGAGNQWRQYRVSSFAPMLSAVGVAKAGVPCTSCGFLRLWKGLAAGGEDGEACKGVDYVGHGAYRK